MLIYHIDCPLANTILGYYPLVNVYITMVQITILLGKTENELSTGPFSSSQTVNVYQRLKMVDEAKHVGSSTRGRALSQMIHALLRSLFFLMVGPKRRKFFEGSSL